MKEETLTTPTKKSVLTKSQKQIITRMRPRKKYRAEVRYDDECGNGHNTFAIVVEWWEQAKNNRWVWCGSGCGDSAENFDRVFPELVPLAKWHLMSSDGPMYYIANTVYHASDRDCWGHKAGKARDLAAARTSAIWPEATDEQLCLPEEQLTELLNARLPALMAEFRKDIEAFGFVF